LVRLQPIRSLSIVAGTLLLHTFIDTNHKWMFLCSAGAPFLRPGLHYLIAARGAAVKTGPQATAGGGAKRY
jgi:hypothetical protein